MHKTGKENELEQSRFFSFKHYKHFFTWEYIQWEAYTHSHTTKHNITTHNITTKLTNKQHIKLKEKEDHTLKHTTLRLQTLIYRFNK